MAKLPRDQWIGGKAVAGDGPDLTIVDPSSGQVAGTVTGASEQQVAQAVRAAGEAFPKWAAATPRERFERLAAFADSLARQADDLAKLEALDTGKPLSQARRVDVGNAIDAIRFFAGAGRAMMTPAAGDYVTGHTSFVRRDPVGIVSAMTPWNYPMLMAAWKLAPALAAGCTLVLKPSEFTNLTTLAMAAASEGILPPGVFNVVTGSGPDIGHALLRHPTIDMIAVTGSIATGTHALTAARETIKRTHLELGGKSPVIVLSDVDVEECASRIAEAAFYNAGQDCTAATRLLVDKSVHDRFAAAFIDAAARLRPGHVDDPNTTFGPLVTPPHVARVKKAIADASEAGHLATQAITVPETGLYVPPTIFAGVGATSTITSEETFGPVVSISPVADAAEALAAANATRYGLASSVWSSDQGLALGIAAQLRFGITWINTHATMATEMPHGGLRSSGYGSDQSLESLRDYTVARHICLPSPPPTLGIPA